MVVSAPQLAKRAFVKILIAFATQYHVALTLTRESADKNILAADRRAAPPPQKNMQCGSSTHLNICRQSPQGCDESFSRIMIQDIIRHGRGVVECIRPLIVDPNMGFGSMATHVMPLGVALSSTLDSLAPPRLLAFFLLFSFTVVHPLEELRLVVA